MPSKIGGIDIIMESYYTENQTDSQIILLRIREIRQYKAFN